MRHPSEANIHPDERVISIRGLYKSFASPVLQGVDLDLKRGENVAVLGRSGTGKSVLIKIIIGLLKPDRGEVWVLGQNVPLLKGKELDALRLRIGFSFQNSALYDSMNVRQNLEFPLHMNFKHIGKKDRTMQVEEVLEAVGLSYHLNSMPSELSG